MTRVLQRHSNQKKPDIELHRLSDSLPDQAIRWINLISSEVCDVREIDKASTLQKQIHGLIPYLLLARDWPAIVVGSAADMKQLIDHAIKVRNIQWLRKDAFIMFVTDEQGLILGNDAQLNTHPWSESSLQCIRQYLTYFALTNTMKGYSRETFNVRKKIIRYALSPPSTGLSRSPVLILGPSRSGKEVVAQTLYQASGLPSEKFEPVGCGMLQSHMLLDQLFGHWQGAFTGAIQSTPGYLEYCHGGAVFLDDFDAATNPQELQSALLRFMSTNPPRVRRLGFPAIKKEEGQLSIAVTTWLIFATNKSPRQMIEEEMMREDFLHRFNHIIKVTSFRERPHDIPHIAKALAKTIPDIRPLDIEALRWLRDRDSPWAGNASELKALLVCSNDILYELPTLTWTEAFQKVIRRGQDFLDWYGGDEICTSRSKPSSHPHIDYWRLILKEHNSRKKSRKKETVEAMLNVLEQFLNHSGYTEVRDFNQQLEHRLRDNPSAVHCFRFLLYLVLCHDQQIAIDDVLQVFGNEFEKSRYPVEKIICGNKHELTKQRVIQGMLNLSWKTVNTIGKTLADSSLMTMQTKLLGDRPYFVYSINPDLLASSND